MSLVLTIIPSDPSRSENIRLQDEARSNALATLRDLRRQARQEIERLLAFLDESDIDPDLEPWLGFPDGSTGHAYNAGVTDDREADDADLEPSLCGVTANHLLVSKPCPISGISPVVDGEQEQDDEPSLGSVDVDNQMHWASGTRDDREEQHDQEEDDRNFTWC